MHIRRICVNSPRHPAQAKKVHGEKCEIEANKEQPEMPVTQRRVHHAAGDFRNPEVEPGKHREHCAADKNVMKMRHDKKRIVHLPIDGNGSEHYAREAADKKHEEKSKKPQHW